MNELGGIYLDIVKDRLYTCKDSSHARRSCQTSLDYVMNTLVRLIAVDADNTVGYANDRAFVLGLNRDVEVIDALLNNFADF